MDKDDIQIIEKTHANLDDFLYETDSNYTRKTAAKLFDYIDVVFIEGDVNLLPWQTHAQKVTLLLVLSPLNSVKFNILLRMCMRSKKPLFASAFAMQSLVYLCASNHEKV